MRNQSTDTYIHHQVLQGDELVSVTSTIDYNLTTQELQIINEGKYISSPHQAQ